MILEKEGVFFLHRTSSTKIPNIKEEVTYSKGLTWINTNKRYSDLLKHKEYTFLTGGNNLLVLKNNSIVFKGKLDTSIKKPTRTMELIFDNEELYIASNNGCYIYSLAENKIVNHIFKNLFVTSIHIDLERNFWLSFRDNGISKINSFNIQNIKLKSSKIVKVKTFNNNLYASDITGQVYKVLENFNLKKIKKAKDVILNESFDFYVDRKENVYILDRTANFRGLNNTFSLLKRTMALRGVIEHNKNEILITTNKQLYFLNLKKFKITNEAKFKTTSVSSLSFKDKNNKIWVGTEIGLYFFNENNNTIQKSTNNNELLNKRILDLNETIKGQLLIGTKGSGLVVMGKDSTYAITKRNGLLSNYIESIYTHKDNSIWLGTNKGVSKIENTVSYTHLTLPTIYSV